MNDAFWETHNLGAEIVKILESGEKEHSLGNAFFTAYQIAITLVENNPSLEKFLDENNIKIGGKGIGEHVSFSQYIAKQLSKRVKEELKDKIEGGFLSNCNLSNLSFKFKNEIIESSSKGKANELSIFRLKSK